MMVLYRLQMMRMCITLFQHRLDDALDWTDAAGSNQNVTSPCLRVPQGPRAQTRPIVCMSTRSSAEAPPCTTKRTKLMQWQQIKCSPRIIISRLKRGDQLYARRYAPGSVSLMPDILDVTGERGMCCAKACQEVRESAIHTGYHRHQRVEQRREFGRVVTEVLSDILGPNGL